MGPRDQNRKVRNVVCGAEEPLLERIVVTAVSLANVLVTTQRVKIRDVRSQTEEYNLTANLDITRTEFDCKAIFTHFAHLVLPLCMWHTCALLCILIHCHLINRLVFLYITTLDTNDIWVVLVLRFQRPHTSRHSSVCLGTVS